MMKYFKGRISRGFFAIYSGRMVLRISGAMLGIFMPIFLYDLFDFDIRYVLGYYFFGSFLYAVTVAWGAKYLNRIGMRRALLISTFFGILYYIIFYLINHYFVVRNVIFDEQGRNILIVIFILIVVNNFWKMLYWVPLHVDIAKFTNKTNRGKELGLVAATSIFLEALMPLFAGWILLIYDFGVLFIIAIVIFLISLIPFSSLPRTREHFSWGYWQSWKEFFSRKRRRVVLAYISDGAENVVGVIVWPIFIWEILEGSYFSVGALTALVVFISIFLQLFIGDFSDKKDKNKMIKMGNFLYAIGWIAKIFVATAFHIFIISTYHNFAKLFARTPFDTLTYEKAADEGHYVDEFTVIHEIAIAAGKCLMIIFVFLLVGYLGINWTFVLAAFASLAMNFLTDDIPPVKRQMSKG